MRGVDFALLFFIIYDVIITWVFYYIYSNTKRRSDDKDKYIDELLFELAKARKK